MNEGKVNSKFQLTLPLEVRRAPGIKPGDRVRYDVQEGKLSMSVMRPDSESVLDYLLANRDLSALHEEVGNDATAYMREQRGWEGG